MTKLAVTSTLESAVISTLAYSDVFGYPVTLAETHRYLHGVKADIGAVLTALEALQRSGAITCDGRLFALSGRERLFAQRSRRERIAARLWPRARRYARALASIGTVTMVGVTGSLAAGNPADEADIDIMLVTAGGALWRTRALARLLVCADRRLNGNLCVNYFRSERALELPCRDLYMARELAQMVPLFGLETYATLRRHNRWVLDVLPNAAGPPGPVPRSGPGPRRVWVPSPAPVASIEPDEPVESVEPPGSIEPPEAIERPGSLEPPKPIESIEPPEPIASIESIERVEPPRPIESIEPPDEPSSHPSRSSRSNASSRPSRRNRSDRSGPLVR